MELFEEVLKYFPVMENYAKKLFKKTPPEKRVGEWKNELAGEMIQWIWDELLDEHSILYQTFLQAGFTNKLDMSWCMFEWHMWDCRIKQCRKRISRADTPPAQE